MGCQERFGILEYLLSYPIRSAIADIRTKLAKFELHDLSPLYPFK